MKKMGCSLEQGRKDKHAERLARDQSNSYRLLTPFHKPKVLPRGTQAKAALLLTRHDGQAPLAEQKNAEIKKFPEVARKTRQTPANQFTGTLPINSHLLSTSFGPGPQEPKQESKLSQHSLLAA